MLSFLEKLLAADRRWVFLSVGVVTVLFLVLPFEQEVAIQPESRKFFDAVDALKPGDAVYLAIDYDPASQAEVYPMHRACVQHLFRKDVKIVCGELWPGGPGLADDVFAEAAERNGKKYGEDYVHLGYKAGRDIALRGIAESLWGTYPTDIRGTPVGQVPLMKRVQKIQDVKLIVSFASGDPGTRQWLNQVQGRLGVPIVAGVTAVMAPELYPFVQSGQVRGLLGGLSSAAEYELLVNDEKLRTARAGMNVQSFVHVLLVLLILVGNAAYAVLRLAGKGRKA